MNARVHREGVGRPQHGVLSGKTMSPTVLVTELDTGALVIQGRPDGPRAYLHPDDAVPLKQELAAAFERAEKVVQNNGGEAW
ncbi:MAG: hypothetical protein ACRDSH_00495 [Pseudonocardiaceae bacterium]